MAFYRMYFIGQSGRIRGVMRLECDEEEEVRRRAAESIGAYAVELWRGLRLVASFGRRIGGERQTARMERLGQPIGPMRT
jgi:hypothetical protein